MTTIHNDNMKSPTTKQAFVTIGATAGFEDLIKETLSQSVLQTFAKEGYTKIRLQVGNSMDYFDNIRPQSNATFGLEIEAFDFDRNGLGQEMRGCQAKGAVRLEGIVISHAGSGTILDALRLGLPLIVVPNSSLLDNHQEELAEELERQGYATRSNTGGLVKAIEKAERKKGTSKKWGGASKSLAPIVDETVNYEMESRSLLD